MTDAERAQAEAVVGEWTWQVADGHNYRYAKAVNTLTRYYEAASLQPDELRIVLAYLKEQTFAGGISLMNRPVDFGTGWVAKDAWYQTAPGDKWANTESTKVRVYQTLIQPSGNGEDGPYLLENGCQYKVHHTFYWDVAALPGVPASTSGVAYDLKGVARDRETGLWSCVIEKRERVQQDIAEYVTAETAFETTKEETHLGVKQSAVNSTGKPAGAANGKVVRRKVTKNADCTSNVENATVEEKAVKGVRKSWRKTLRGTVASETDRSQASPLDGSGMVVGETRTSEETEGERWNNTVEKTTAEAAGKIGQRCGRTAGTHTDTTLTNENNEPSVEQAEPGANEEIEVEATKTEQNTFDVRRTKRTWKPQSVETESGSASIRTKTKVGVNQTAKPADGAGGVNVVRRTSASPNDHGSYSTTEETTTYLPKGATARGGALLAPRTTRVEKNATSADISEMPEKGKTVEASVEPNDHGSFEKRLVVTEHKRLRGKTTGKGAVKAKRSVEIVRHADDDTVSEAPEQGKTVSATVTQNDDGTFDKHIEILTRDELRGKTTGKGSVRAKRSVEIVRNAKDQTVIEAPEKNKTVEASVTQNEDGTFDKNIYVTQYEEEEKSKTWEDGSFYYNLYQYRNKASIQVPTGTHDHVDVSFRMNDHGTYDGHWMTRNLKVASGQTLQISSHVNIDAYVPYKKNGEIKCRKVEAKKYIYFGKANPVMDALQGCQDVPEVGWWMTFNASGPDRAMGIGYKNVTVGPEIDYPPPAPSES